MRPERCGQRPSSEYTLQYRVSCVLRNREGAMLGAWLMGPRATCIKELQQFANGLDGAMTRCKRA